MLWGRVLSEYVLGDGGGELGGGGVVGVGVEEVAGEGYCCLESWGFEMGWMCGVWDWFMYGMDWIGFAYDEVGIHSEHSGINWIW